jgi:N-acetylneuraminic acid mutarotase
MRSIPLLLLCPIILLLPGAATTALAADPAPLTLDERIACRTAVEQVYRRHRIWPPQNPGAKPPLAAVLPQEAVQAQVERTLRLSSALGSEWRRPVTDRELRAELARIWRDTRNPELLRDLSRSLGDDPYLLAECLARPLLVDRLARSYFAAGERSGQALDGWLEERATALPIAGGTRPGDYRDFALPALAEAGAGPVDEWQPTAALPEGVGGISVVWTGSEMIVWGGGRDTGARYDPATDTWRTTAALGAPSARSRHTAVWTGTEMIVWGGCGQSFNFCELGSGGRYDPATDSWAPIASAGALTRRLHTAVWTGTEMIVWGGCRTGSFGNNACEIELGDGGRYDPDADQWTLASTVDEPGPRQFHSAVWTGSEMIVWGGTPNTGPTVGASGGRYHPATDTWSATSLAGAPAPRASHTAVWTGAEMIVWGGCDNSICASGNNPLADGARYDPVTDDWSPVAAAGAPVARTEHTAVWTGGEMIVWGGQGTELARLASGGRYDPAADAWSATPEADAPPGRAGHRAVWTGSEMIVWGQLDEFNRKSGGRYDPATDSWAPTSLNDPRRARERHAAVWTGAEMLVWGGDTIGGGPSGEGDRYDPATDSWTPMSDLGEPANRKHGFSAVWTGTEMIVWGGQSGTSLFETGGRYSPATDSWQPTSTAGAPDARAYAAMAWTGTQMIVWGGATLSAFESASGGRYDPATDGWTATSMVDAPPASTFPSGVWTGDELIVWGGLGGGSDLVTGGRYRPDTDSWTAISTTGAPPGRHFHSAHWTGEEMLIWGGMEGNLDAGTYFADGARYSPALDAWTPIPAAGAPGARIWHASVWTGGELLVWGGCHGPANCGTAYADGGSYSPTTGEWAPTPAASAPSARSKHTGVWTGDRLIVWGGLADSYGSYTTTGGLLGPETSPPPTPSQIFADGFEEGDMSRWSVTAP